MQSWVLWRSTEVWSKSIWSWTEMVLLQLMTPCVWCRCALHFMLHINLLQPQPLRVLPIWYWTPFLHGQSVCNGEFYILTNFISLIVLDPTCKQMEAKVVLVHLLRTYNLSLPTNYCLKLDAESIFCNQKVDSPALWHSESNAVIVLHQINIFSNRVLVQWSINCYV